MTSKNKSLSMAKNGKESGNEMGGFSEDEVNRKRHRKETGVSAAGC